MAPPLKEILRCTQDIYRKSILSETASLMLFCEKHPWARARRFGHFMLAENIVGNTFSILVLFLVDNFLKRAWRFLASEPK